MYKLVPDFDLDCFRSLIHDGIVEQCPSQLDDTDFAVRIPMYGNKYSNRGNGVDFNYLPRLSVSYLKKLYTQVCEGRIPALQRVTKLYRLGLGVPRSDIHSALWSEMPFNGALDLPDGQRVTFADLKYVLKQHLKESFKRSGLYVYPVSVVSYYDNIASSIKPVSGKATAATSINVCGSDQTFVANYICNGENFKLSHVVLVGDKFADITYQSIVNNYLPRVFDNKLGIRGGKRLAVIGKLSVTDADIDDTVNELISLDLDRLEDIASDEIERTSENKNFIRKYQDLSEKAAAYLQSIASRKKLTKQEIRKRDSAQRLRDEMRNRNKALRQERRDLEQSLENKPVKNLQFLALEFAVVSGNVNKPLRDKDYYRLAAADSKAVLKKLRELGFSIMSKPKSSPDYLYTACRVSDKKGVRWVAK